MGLIESELRFRTTNGLGCKILSLPEDTLFLVAETFSDAEESRLAPALPFGNLLLSLTSRIAIPVTCSDRVPSLE